MKFLILFLLIPVSFADSARQCDGLAKVLNNYEKELQGKALEKCNDVKIEDLIKDVNFAIPEFLNEEIHGTTLSRKCSTVSALEAEIQNLKVQQSVLDGFEKLKASIEASKNKTAERDAAIAKRAGKTFVDRLSAASGLEALLATRVKHRNPGESGNIDKPILQVIRSKGPATKEGLKDLVKSLCANEDKTDQDACNPSSFQPTDPAIEDIVNLINANDKIEDAQIQMFTDSLRIQRKTPDQDGKKDYSFRQMSAEMKEAFQKLDKNEVLTKAHLRAIKGLSDFESNPNFDIADGLMTAGLQNDVKLASNKVFLHMQDGLSRQEYEIRNKMSVLWETHRDKLATPSPSTVDACHRAKDDLEAAILCQKYLKDDAKKVTNQTARTDMTRTLASLEDNINYYINLDSDLGICREQLIVSKELTEACLKKIPNSLANVNEKIIQLNALKEKIGQENLNLMKLRNYALYKWDKNNCGKNTDATMDFCEVENSTLSKETKLTVSDALKVAILFVPDPKAEEEGKALCENEEISKKHPICKEVVVSDVVPPIVNEGVNGPTDAPDGEHNQAALRDAWIGAGTNLLKEALGHILPQRPPPGLPNPYPYNFRPYNGGQTPMGISDTILFNARFQGGYGFYAPTPGYQPYTAFGATSTMTPYRPIGGGGLFR